MSIKRMSAVWEQSIMTGNDLLLMLAIADNAADDGYCWPSIETLAHKTRMHRTTVMRCVEGCEFVGELYVRHSRRYGNRYLVLVGLELPQIKQALIDHFSLSGDALSSTMRHIEETLSKSQVVRLEKLQAMRLLKSQAKRHDPSKNRQEKRHIAPTPKNGVGARATKTKTTSKRKASRITRDELNALIEAVLPAMGYARETLTDEDWSMLRGVCSTIGAAGAKPKHIGPFVVWLHEVKGPALGFNDFTVAALKKYWKDYAKTLVPPTPVPKPRPDCEQCGGTGLIIAVHPDGREETVPCPDCRAAAESARKEEAIHA